MTKNNLSTSSYKGSKDLYPEDKFIQNYIFDVWAKTSRSFGFLEYGAPLLEPIEIYLAKSGEELASQQTYVFDDRGGRKVAIRPEMTPTVCRLVAQKRQELAYPARLFSIANFMRYERPQKGREREFWQLNADIFGDDSIYADIEILAMAAQVLFNFGATEEMFDIRINDRRLINELTKNYLGLNQETSKKLIRLLDQKDKLKPADFKQGLEELISDASSLEKLLNLLENPELENLPAEIKQSQNYQNIATIIDELEKQGINNACFDLFLMRGLDYYTGTVFELFDTDPTNNRSLFGGGRYDGLVSYFGAEPISAVGVAPGASTCLEFIKGHNLMPNYQSSTNILIIPIDDTESESAKIAQKLRTQGFNVEIDYTNRKIAKKIKAADKKNIENIMVIGKQELETNNYKIKNLKTGEIKQINL